MAFFNPFDVVTSGAKAVPGLPGMGPSQEAINAGKVNAPVGSLGALGGGMNSPQPVPGMPPQKFDGPVGNIGFPVVGLPIPPNPIWATSETGLQTGPEWGMGNRGSGQPINQPMNPNQGHVTPIAGPGWDYNYDPTTGRGTTDYNYPASQLPNQGSLQSLGGGQLNQSGMVNLRGTDGTTKAVPQQDLAHWLSKGAVRV